MIWQRRIGIDIGPECALPGRRQPNPESRNRPARAFAARILTDMAGRVHFGSFVNWSLRGCLVEGNRNCGRGKRNAVRFRPISLGIEIRRINDECQRFSFLAILIRSEVTMFNGFPTDGIKFFKELAKHNNRDWFAENKSRYEASVLGPALALVEDMQGPLKKVSPHFLAIPKRSGGSLMRIYRDTRFSKDRTPYKTNLGIHFRHEAGKNVHAPGFYFHVDPKEIFVGAGIWHPDNKTLNQIRTLIDDDPKRWKRVVNAKSFKSVYELRGESLKRPPRGYDSDHPLITDLKRKDHFGLTRLTEKDLLDRGLIEKLTKHFKTAVPYVRFLCDSIHQPC